MTGKEPRSIDGSGETTTRPETSGESSQEHESSSSLSRTPAERMTEAQKADAVAALLRGEQPNGAGDDGSEQHDPGTEAGGGEGENAPPAASGPESAHEGEVDAEQGSSPKSEDGTSAASTEPLTLKAAAEKLGVAPEELYKLEISTGDGETVSLSELKDGWQTRAQAERETAERAAALDGREARVIADQQVWSTLAASGQLPPQAMRAAVEQLQQVVERETDLLFELVPEFEDAAKFDGFRRNMVRALGDVGYKPHEVAFTDHRQALFVRRYLQQERELAAAKEELTRLRRAGDQPPRAGKPNGRGGKPQGSAVMKRARGGSEADKVNAVSHLLRGS